MLWAYLSCSTLVSVVVKTRTINKNKLTTCVAWYMQGDYLLAVLVLGFDESLKSATRIQSLYRLVLYFAPSHRVFVLTFHQLRFRDHGSHRRPNHLQGATTQDDYCSGYGVVPSGFWPFDPLQRRRWKLQPFWNYWCPGSSWNW